jgi:hypothetical protein
MVHQEMAEATDNFTDSFPSVIFCPNTDITNLLLSRFHFVHNDTKDIKPDPLSIICPSNSTTCTAYIKYGAFILGT